MVPPVVEAMEGVALVRTLPGRPTEDCRSASEGARNDEARSGVEAEVTRNWLPDPRLVMERPPPFE